MAEGGYVYDYDPHMNKQKTLCRYFMHGSCRRGDSCNFVHSRDGTAPLNNICKFYLLGRCTYGQNCRYDHVKASSSSQRLEERKVNSTKLGLGNTERNSNMVVLKKEGLEKSLADADNNKRQAAFQEKWVKASDFVPGQRFHNNTSYASTTKTYMSPEESSTAPSFPPEPTEGDLLCPFYAQGACPYEEKCNYLHGDICDICNLPQLHPTDEALRESHKKECMAEMEKDMELSFAVQESQDKECCICLDMVVEKAERGAKSDARFGILENCTHCFCLECIRRWRSDKDKDFGKQVRGCPICRIHSDFVTPSKFWVEDEEKKKNLIQDYKAALGKKSCHYFKQGKGECPFNNKCFYRHAYPDGTIATPEPKKWRRRVNADGEEDITAQIILWNFLEERNDAQLSIDDELSLFLSLTLGQDSDDDSDLDSDTSATDLVNELLLLQLP